MAVLDICCGMGASAIPAAERVGPAGKVIAVDLWRNWGWENKAIS
jgi:ubiquinone/menaquinone biosynthesis C-methylase UbiE